MAQNINPADHSTANSLKHNEENHAVKDNHAVSKRLVGLEFLELSFCSPCCLDYRRNL